MLMKIYSEVQQLSKSSPTSNTEAPNKFRILH